jgi:hypothetical protein
MQVGESASVTKNENHLIVEMQRKLTNEHLLFDNGVSNGN